MCNFLYKNVICLYFPLAALFGMLEMLHFHLFEYTYVFLMSLIVVSFGYFNKNKLGKIDIAVVCSIIFILFFSLINIKYKTLLIGGIREEIIPMLAFFIGKDPERKDNKIFNYGVYTMFVVGIIGLLLYVLAPGWYISFRLENKDYVTDGIYMEMTRLSAFWEYPYWISYGAAIIYSYLLGRYLIEKKININKSSLLILLIFLIAISVLTQQRASIGGILFSTAFYFYLYQKNNRLSFKSIFVPIVLITLCIIVIYYSVIAFLDTTRIDFMMSKFTAITESDTNFLDDRANIFDNMKNVEITLIGDGLGLYSHNAYGMGLQKYITDQGYMKMLYETGIIGIGLRMLVVFICLIKGLSNFNSYFFEITIIVIILVSLTGANSLSSLQMHNIIFWLCCGRVFNKSRLIHQ